MIVALDVHYLRAGARAAAVAFADWADPAPAQQWTVELDAVGAYEPGAFFRRELPCLLAVLAATPAEVGQPETVVIDGYVWLDAGERPGLGAYLYDALDRRTPIVGVAKNPFCGADAVPVQRGTSTRPLFVTAAGTSPAVAAGHVRAMDGPHRVPTLLRWVDALARQG